jgi:hypothetical protein
VNFKIKVYVTCLRIIAKLKHITEIITGYDEISSGIFAFQSTTVYAEGWTLS